MADELHSVVTVYCPRCGRRYTGKTEKQAMEVMEKHFEGHNEDMPSSEHSDD